MKQVVLFVALMLMATLGKAGVYKCMTSGNTIYSEKPCSQEATSVNIQVKEPSTSDLVSAQAKIKTDSRTNEVSKIEREIRGYKDDMDRELARLREQQSEANNNLAGATWLQSISAEMSAVTSKYQLKIQEAQHRLDAVKSSK